MKMLLIAKEMTKDNTGEVTKVAIMALPTDYGDLAVDVLKRLGDKRHTRNYSEASQSNWAIVYDDTERYVLDDLW